MQSIVWKDPSLAIPGIVKFDHNISLTHCCACVHVDSRSYLDTPRLFHMTSASSTVFDVVEILSPCRTDDDDVCVLMPFLQEDLYAASQPGQLTMLHR